MFTMILSDKEENSLFIDHNLYYGPEQWYKNDRLDQCGLQLVQIEKETKSISINEIVVDQPVLA